MAAGALSSILAILAYLVPFIVDALKKYQVTNQGGNHDANIQEFRQSLVKGDHADIAARLADQHDRVRAALCGC